jgi:hypothetical protein
LHEREYHGRLSVEDNPDEYPEEYGLGRGFRGGCDVMYTAAGVSRSVCRPCRCCPARNSAKSNRISPLLRKIPVFGSIFMCHAEPVPAADLLPRITGKAVLAWSGVRRFRAI